MQIVCYTENGMERIGFLVDTKIYECRSVDPNLPANKDELERKWKRCEKLARLMFHSLENGHIKYALYPIKATDAEGLELIDLTKWEKIK